MDKKTLKKILREHKKWLDSNKTKGSRASLAGEDLHGTSLYKANLEGADLHGASLRGADLKGATMRCADLRGANLCAADLGGANMREVDLRGAILSGAALRGADLSYADLRGANLYDANLRGANLRCTVMREVDLCGADLCGADMDYSCWPLWCYSLNVKIDKRLACQLLYHTVRAMQSVDDARCKAVCNDPKVIRLANEFHRVEECGKIRKEGSMSTEEGK